MENPGAEDITHLLLEWRGGNDEALGQLMPQVYRQLREIAGHLMRRENVGHTLHATALVHEAYLKVIDLERIEWRDRVHFFAMCARIMRRVLVEHARRHGRDKRGGDAQRVDLDGVGGLDGLAFGGFAGENPQGVIALDDALNALADHDPERSKIVELRFFGGLDREQIAEAMGMSSATVTRRWRSARAWLIDYLGAGTGE